MHNLHPNLPLCLEQIEVANKHPQPGKAESGRVVGVHLVHEGVSGVVALLDKRERLVFALVDAFALLLDKLAMVLKWFAVARINPINF